MDYLSIIGKGRVTNTSIDVTSGLKSDYAVRFYGTDNLMFFKSNEAATSYLDGTCYVFNVLEYEIYLHVKKLNVKE